MKESIIQGKTFQFAKNIISLYKQLQKNNEFVLSKQILRSGTSIGANVSESSAAVSKRDFVNKLAIASKEARETKYWLRLLDETDLSNIDVKKYLDDIQEINNMISKIIKTTQERYL
ncbi:MAG: four helix bundle protein [Sphingobacteriales bacterium]|nr:four helix bundle protein [Sphingobacteriales bacterium]